MGSTAGPYFEPIRAGLLEDTVEVGPGAGHEPRDASFDVVGPLCVDAGVSVSLRVSDI